jgi:glucose/arabinose dehydrogenase
MRALIVVGLWCGVTASASPVFGPGVDPSLFRVTQFATGLAYPQGMQQLPDGSIVVQTSPGFYGGQILRFTDSDGDGMGTPDALPLYTNPSGQGPQLQLVSAGDYLIQGSQGTHSLSILAAGATPDAPRTEVGVLSFEYPDGAWHTNAGLAVRPTPGNPGHWDLVFNVGAGGDDFPGGPVILNGLGLVGESLNGASLYLVTLDLTGDTPVALGLRQVATGIRNVFGLQFDSAGNLWFSDNGIDASSPGLDPLQADELNRMTPAQLMPGSPVLDFGFPLCYPAYADGVHAVSTCIHPEAAFIPVDGPLGTMRSQGAGQIAFAPTGFPLGFNGGVFIGFSGDPNHVRNPILYYDPATGQYQHFILEGSMTYPVGLLGTSNSLFISDFGSGNIFQITSAVPEPSTFAAAALGLLGLAMLRLRAASK